MIWNYIYKIQRWQEFEYFFNKDYLVLQKGLLMFKIIKYVTLKVLSVVEIIKKLIKYKDYGLYDLSIY